MLAVDKIRVAKEDNRKESRKIRKPHGRK